MNLLHKIFTVLLHSRKTRSFNFAVHPLIHLSALNYVRLSVICLSEVTCHKKGGKMEISVKRTPLYNGHFSTVPWLSDNHRFSCMYNKSSLTFVTFDLLLHELLPFVLDFSLPSFEFIAFELGIWNHLDIIQIKLDFCLDYIPPPPPTKKNPINKVWRSYRNHPICLSVCPSVRLFTLCPVHMLHNCCPWPKGVSWSWTMVQGQGHCAYIAKILVRAITPHCHIG